jgi:hypothetical protein
MTHEATTFEKATIYTTSDFMGNVTKTEVRKGEVRHCKHAQYDNAVEVKFVAKRQRKLRGFVKSHQPYVLILEGHNHPDPASMFGDADAEGCATGRHRSFDDGWVSDFESTINQHIEDTNATVIFSDREKAALCKLTEDN